MNINSLNNKMFSRDIENEFLSNESGQTIKSLLNVSQLDISNYSATIGISLSGSLKKINEEISNNIENFSYHKISKYIDYVKNNIEYLDLTKVQDSFIISSFENGKTSFNFVRNFFVLYLHALSKDLNELRETTLLILSKIIDKSLENTNHSTFAKFKTILMTFHEILTIKGKGKYDFTLWEDIFNDLFYNIFFNYDLTKKLNDIDKFNVKEVLNYQKSQIIKITIANIVKNSISDNCNVINNKNINLSSLYNKNWERLNNDINTLRNKGDFFTSSILINFLEIFNEY